MADISRFDSPAQSNVINTFVANPIPFQELMQAGAYRTQQHEQGLARLNQGYETVYNTKYNPNTADAATVKEQIGNARQIVDQYTNSGQDLGDPVARQQMIRDLNTKVDNTLLKNIEATAHNIEEYNKMYQNLLKKGKIAPWEENKFPWKDWDTKNGVFNEMPQEFNNNYDKDLKEQIFDKIHPTEIGSYFAKDTDGNVTNTRVSQYGITKDKIDNYLMPDGKNIDPSIRNLQAVQTMLKVERHNHGLDPNKESKYDDQLIQMGLHNRGDYMIGYKETEHNLAEPKGGNKNLNGGNLSALLPERTSSATPIPGSDNFYDNHKKVIDEVNKLGKNAPKDKVEEANTYKRKLDETNKLVLNNHKDDFVQLNNNFKNELKKQGFTPEQAEDMFKKMTEPVNGDSRDIRHYTGEALRQNISNFFKRIAYNLPISVVEGISDPAFSPLFESLKDKYSKTKGLESIVYNYMNKIHDTFNRVNEETQKTYNDNEKKSESINNLAMIPWTDRDKTTGEAYITNNKGEKVVQSGTASQMNKYNMTPDSYNIVADDGSKKGKDLNDFIKDSHLEFRDISEVNDSEGNPIINMQAVTKGDSKKDPINVHQTMSKRDVIGTANDYYNKWAISTSKNNPDGDKQQLEAACRIADNSRGKESLGNQVYYSSNNDNKEYKLYGGEKATKTLGNNGNAILTFSGDPNHPIEVENNKSSILNALHIRQTQILSQPDQEYYQRTGQIVPYVYSRMIEPYKTSQ
jgi:hypothetical protein